MLRVPPSSVRPFGLPPLALSSLSLFLLQQAALTLMEQHFAINALHTHGRAHGGRRARMGRARAGLLTDGRTRRTETDHRTPKQEDPLIHDQISHIQDEPQSLGKWFAVMAVLEALFNREDVLPSCGSTSMGKRPSPPGPSCYEIGPVGKEPRCVEWCKQPTTFPKTTRERAIGVHPSVCPPPVLSSLLFF